jgi:putative mRNA 3-end processing factor
LEPSLQFEIHLCAHSNGLTITPAKIPCTGTGTRDSVTELHFLGGCKTIGSSAYLIRENETSVLCDFGASFNGNPTFPQLSRPANLTIALSHAHLDHSGGLPLLFASGSAPVYMTAITRDLIRLLLKDMIRLSNYYLPFEKEEVDRLIRRTRIVNYREPIEITKDITLTFHDAGHIPGSAALQVQTPTHDILYSGDINTIDTQMLKAARIPQTTPDTLILESTYALTAHDDRERIEETFVTTAEEIIDNGGTVLVPAFAVARAQEILCVLNKYRVDFPIYMDGMARDAARIFLHHPSFFRNFRLLKRALDNTQWIRSRRQREGLTKNPGLIVAPAGMLRGGTAAMYLSEIMHNPRNAVLLVGFQIPGTPGRELLDNGSYDDGTGLKRVKAKFQLFDFSSHAGQEQLLDLASSFPNLERLYTVHGEAEACNYLAKTLHKTNGINAHAAETGQQIELP